MSKVIQLHGKHPSDPSLLLRSARRRAGMTREQYASALGSYLGRPHLSAGTLQIWEEGKVAPPPDVVQAALEMQHITAGPATCSVVDLIRASTAEAATLVTSATTDDEYALLTGQAYANANELATRYLTSPPAPMLEQAHRHRRYVLAMLQDHMPPSDARDLYLVAGLLSGISAYACLDLGYADAAMKQAEAALLCADFAGHDGLKAWVFGTESLIARFQGRYRRALDLATQGLGFATSGTALDRLRSGQAQSLACLGDTPATRHALHLADDAREAISTPDVAGGIFTFPEAKHSYYSGSSLIWLPQPPEAKLAEQQSERAIELFSSGPENERNLADEALAHIYLATSRVTLGDLDGVLDALRPVLNIPPEDRISWQRKRLDRLAKMLDAPRFRRSTVAGPIREEITAFSASPSG